MRTEYFEDPRSEWIAVGEDGPHRTYPKFARGQTWQQAHVSSSRSIGEHECPGINGHASDSLPASAGCEIAHGLLS